VVLGVGKERLDLELRKEKRLSVERMNDFFDNEIIEERGVSRGPKGFLA